MASILERYGIKEVADFTFYEINDDGTPGNPVLYLDTLKVSTVEQTASAVYAQGGKGNPRLIGWDFGKEITLNLEDALFSPKSMAIMFGDGTVDTTTTSIKKTIKAIAGKGGTLPTTWKGPGGKSYPIPTEGAKYSDENGADLTAPFTAGTHVFITFDVAVEGQTIIIGANTFPGTYYMCGDTYARNEITGKDEFFQIVVPKGKITSENTLTMEAEGDPSVFSMSVDVLRSGDSEMMRLIKYSVNEG